MDGYNTIAIVGDKVFLDGVPVKGVESLALTSEWGSSVVVCELRLLATLGASPVTEKEPANTLALDIEEAKIVHQVLTAAARLLRGREQDLAIEVKRRISNIMKTHK